MGPDDTTGSAFAFLQMIARHLWISGQVQGVGYRDALCSEARARSVTGWVRNLQDGRVEAHLQGSDESVAAVIAWARRGPDSAKVADVKIDEVPTGNRSDDPEAFLRLPTY